MRAWTRRRQLRLAVLGGLMGCGGALFSCQAAAAALVMQGSTTFNSELVKEHKLPIEETTGIQLDIIPNRSSLGLLALLSGRADLAMISTALANEIEILSRSNPELPLEQLRAFSVGRTRAILIVHPTNAVRDVSLEDLQRLLSGQIRNWKDLGGDDLPVRIAAVREGGGVVSTVEAAVLGFGKSISAPNQIRVQTGPQVVIVVEQELGALGITQLKLTRGRKVLELATTVSLVQELSLVSLGEPSLQMRAVIDEFRAAATSAGLN